MKKTGELTTARELLRSEGVNLINCTLSGDALYANDQNARLIGQEKGGDYLVSLKDNQPTPVALTWPNSFVAIGRWKTTSTGSGMP